MHTFSKRVLKHRLFAFHPLAPPYSGHKSTRAFFRPCQYRSRAILYQRLATGSREPLVGRITKSSKSHDVLGTGMQCAGEPSIVPLESLFLFPAITCYSEQRKKRQRILPDNEAVVASRHQQRSKPLRTCICSCVYTGQSSRRKSQGLV